ncbi:vasohibin-1 [Angomonas deanei]|uniref:Vasohibin, putative n=1 Tax=Angomonas deanei TaxID=59799 RepID=S9U237_9TRYP|nr:vasohibin-1 [Angomonas deanei]EPY39869.1 vasohibin-1 [Angomonas deanei]CAD2215390.1 Vasohibin, putative [Angomonas deanei]|eukprot:EPY24847.1 vasohibin-1 [Angomonas deanei]
MSTKMQKIEAVSRANPFKGATDLPDPPRPSEKCYDPSMSPYDQLFAVQQQLNILSYNHLPTTFYNLEKQRSLQSILLTSKEILTDALPIRCLEATFVGLFLTQEMRHLSRIPIGFRSMADGAHYRHIVLAVQVKGRPQYGAVGLSRKTCLMYKELKFTSLYDLIMDYKKGYESVGHTLVDAKIGLPVSHDSHYRLPPCWRYIAIKWDSPTTEDNPTPDDSSSLHLETILFNFSKLLPSISDQFYKGVNTLENLNRAQRLCFFDLDCCGADAAYENRRRLSLLAKCQSPLGAEARKAVNEKDLPSSKKRSGHSTNKKTPNSRGRVAADSSAPNKTTVSDVVAAPDGEFEDEGNAAVSGASLPSTPRNCSVGTLSFSSPSIQELP